MGRTGREITITQEDIREAIAEKYKVSKEEVDLFFDFDRQKFETTYSEEDSITVEALVRIYEYEEEA